MRRAVAPMAGFLLAVLIIAAGAGTALWLDARYEALADRLTAQSKGDAC